VIGADVPRHDIVTASLRVPRSPAPPLTFVFGRVPPVAATVTINTPLGESSGGELFDAVDGVDLHARYYVRWISGYPYPFVPDVTVNAWSEHGAGVGIPQPDGEDIRPERPPWAEEPRYTTLHSITSGHTGAGDYERDWELAVFRNDATGLVCLGEIGGASVCGPEDDPAAGWEAQLTASCERFGTCTWPPLGDIGGEGGGTPDGVWSFGWGLFRDPVAVVRAERYSLPYGISGPSERDGWLGTQVFELPAEYGSAFRIWLYSCDDCNTGDTFGFDANGQEVARA
jgi:hypothetical protein